ncbi:MAG: ATP-binding cassette subfamily B protein, partial [Kiritimatiellia bacterium]
MRSPLLRLLSYADKHRTTVIMASIFSVLNKIFDLAPPVLIGMAVDTVVNQETSLLAGVGIVDVFTQLLAIAVLTVAIWSLESIFEYLFQWFWRNLAQTIQHELRLDAYDHVQKLDLEWFQGRSSGGLLAILNDDVNQLERFLDGGASALLQLATTVIAVTAAFFIASPGVAGLALIPVPIILWGSFAFQFKLAPRYLEVRERAAGVASQLADNLGGIETIRSFVAEDAELERVRAQSEAYRVSNRRA